LSTGYLVAGQHRYRSPRGLLSLRSDILSGLIRSQPRCTSMYGSDSIILLSVIIALVATATTLAIIAKAQRSERRRFARSNYAKKRPWWADK